MANRIKPIHTCKRTLLKDTDREQLQRQVSTYARRHHAAAEHNDLLSLKKVERFLSTVMAVVDEHLYRNGLC